MSHVYDRLFYDYIRAGAQRSARVILPLLKPVTVTLIVVQSIAIFNDFTNPLYYLPGNKNVTLQLTLFNFQTQFQSQFNLLFMNILLVTIPPLIVYLFFQKHLVAAVAGTGRRA